jgi:pimeloyl-ACP methyl ester carboxylesterase
MADRPATAEGAETAEAVVLIHGLWMTGAELLPLSRRLSGQGLRAHLFHYSPTGGTPQEHARHLAAFVERKGPGPVHWVAHSYGGIVALHCLALGRPLPPGRIVLIGSPVQGSAPARRLAGWPVTRPWFGDTLEHGLLGGVPGLTGGREVAVIAGDRSLGIGGLLAGFDEPHDGTVAVAETVLPGATDRIVLRHSHFGLVFSAAVADAVASFLLTGRLSLESAA